MKISLINTVIPDRTSKNYKYKSKQIKFCSCAHLSHDLYFIRMNTYKRDHDWANKMIKATLSIVESIKNKIGFDELIEKVEKYVNTINDNLHLHGICINKYGIRKLKSKQTMFSLLDYKNSRGYEYYSKYKKKIENSPLKPKSSPEYYKAITAEITKRENTIIIEYGINNSFEINSNLDLVKIEYDKLNSILSPTKQQVVKSVATMQWLIAQETPYLKGSDSIANLLTRSIMHKYGIEISPLKQYTSCDFEGFYRNLNDYINVYPSFFENNLGMK